MSTRVILSAALFTIYACSCAAGPGVVTQPRDLSVRQDEVLRRDVAWIMDTVPIVRFNPPFAYGYFRLQIERCSGLAREGWPKLFQAPINPLPSPDGPALAIYAADDNVIVFALGTVTEPAIFMHELLHFLLRPLIPPEPENETKEQRALRVHPPEYFGATGRCAHVINPKS